MKFSMIVTGLLLVSPLVGPSIANAQDRIILCNEACKERNAERARQDALKARSEHQGFAGKYVFNRDKLDDEILVEKGFKNFDAPKITEGRMRIGAKRLALRDCHKDQRLRFNHNDEVEVIFDDQKTICGMDSCEVVGVCESQTGIGSGMFAPMFRGERFHLNFDDETIDRVTQKLLTSDEYWYSRKKCNIVDSVEHIERNNDYFEVRLLETIVVCNR